VGIKIGLHNIWILLTPKNKLYVRQATTTILSLTIELQKCRHTKTVDTTQHYSLTD